MKKLMGSLILTLTIILGLSLSVPGLADTTTTQQTTVGITFTDDTTTGGQHDQATTPKQGGASATTTANRTIPNGKKPLTKQTGQAADQENSKATATTKQAKRRHPTTLKAAAADLLAGRLPQTSDVQTVLINLIGILLLIVVILSLIIRRQARLLRERE